MEEDRSAFKIITGTPTGNILLGRPRRTWDNNSIIYLKEIGMNRRNWIHFGRIGIGIRMGSGEVSTMRNFISCTVPLT